MGDVFDEHNMPGAESTVYDSEIKTDIKITGSMKMFFLLQFAVHLQFMASVIQKYLFISRYSTGD